MLSSENDPTPQQETTIKPKGNPLAETIREGAIAANIFVGSSKEGKSYHYFALSRSWKNSSSETGYSSSFYAKNSDALNRVIAAASDRCEELDSARK